MPVSLDELEAEAGLKPKKAKAISLGELEGMAGIETSLPEPKLEAFERAPAVSTKAEPFAPDEGGMLHSAFGGAREFLDVFGMVRGLREKLAAQPKTQSGGATIGPGRVPTSDAEIIGEAEKPKSIPVSIPTDKTLMPAATTGVTVQTPSDQLKGQPASLAEKFGRDIEVATQTVKSAMETGGEFVLENTPGVSAILFPREEDKTVAEVLARAGGQILAGHLIGKGMPPIIKMLKEKPLPRIAPKPEPTVTPTEIPTEQPGVKPGRAPRTPQQDFAAIAEQTKVELDHIDKMSRLEANQTMLDLAKERGLAGVHRYSEQELGKAISGLSEEEVKDGLRLNSTMKVGRKVLFPEEVKAEAAAQPQKIELPPEQAGLPLPEPTPPAEMTKQEYVQSSAGNGKPLQELQFEHRLKVEDAAVQGGQPKGAESYPDLAPPEAKVPTVEQFADRAVVGETFTKPEDLQFFQNNVPAVEAELTKRAERGEPITPPKPPAQLSQDDYIAQQLTAAAREPGSALHRQTFVPGKGIEVRPKKLEQLKEEHRQMKVVPEVVDVEAIAKAVEEARPKPVLNPGIEPAAVSLPIDQIATDIDRFQNRTNEVAPETVQAIKENFDPNKLDPIVVWKDPADGQTYVLSGHSRLEGMKQRGEAAIPARFFKGTAEEAHRYATIEANRLATSETLPETIKAYRAATQKGMTQTKLRDLFGADVGFLDAAQNLDPKGQFLDLLSQPPSALESFPYIKRFSRWVGELRGLYPDKLTGQHEQQLFDFLYKTERRNLDISRDNFYHLVQNQLDRLDFNPAEPLILKRTGEVMAGTRARADTAPIEAEITRLRQLQDEARTMPEHEALQREIDRLQTGINDVVKKQTALFGDNPLDIKPRTGELNAVFTADKKDAAFKFLQEKASGQLSAGVDPSVLKAWLDIGGFYVESGIRDFAAWSVGMAKIAGEAIKPYLKQIFDDAVKQADSRPAIMNRELNRAKLTVESILQGFNEIDTGAKMLLDNIGTIAETGTLPSELREAFRTAGPSLSGEALYKYKVSQESMTKTMESLLGAGEQLKNLQQAIEAEGDPLSANSVAAANSATQSVIPAIEELDKVIRTENKAVNLAMLVRNNPIFRQRWLDVQDAFTKAGINLKGLKYIKEKLPILDNIVYSIDHWDKLSSFEKKQFYNNFVDAWRFNLFSLTSFTFDFAGNSAELTAQFDANVGRDIGYVIQKGMHDLLGKEYTAGEEGTLTFPSTRAFLNKAISRPAHSIGQLLQMKSPFEPLSAKIEQGLGRTFIGEKVPGALGRIYSKGMKQTVVKGEHPSIAGVFGLGSKRTYGMSGEVAEWFIGAALHAKSAIDLGAKRLAADMTVLRHAYYEADRLSLSGEDYSNFVKNYYENIPPDITAEAIREGNKAGYNRPLSKMEESIASTLSVKLFLSPFARWGFQYARWAAEMAGWNKPFFSKIIADSHLLHPTGEEYGLGLSMTKNLPEMGAWLAKTATGWGGLYLVGKLFFDDNDPEGGQVDFNLMHYVKKDGNRVRLSNLDPLTTAIWLSAVLRGRGEDAAKSLKYISLPGAQIIGGLASGGGMGGLLSGITSIVGGMANDPTFSNRKAKRTFDQWFNTLIPGRALLSAIETATDPQRREGLFAQVPGLSKLEPASIDMFTGEEMKPEQKPFFGGLRFRQIGGVPVPGMAIQVDPLQALFKQFPDYVRAYPSPAESLAGHSTNDVPEDIYREWQVAFGKRRAEIFASDIASLKELAPRDPAWVGLYLQSRDNKANQFASREVNAQYGTGKKLPKETMKHGPVYERRPVEVNR